MKKTIIALSVALFAALIAATATQACGVALTGDATIDELIYSLIQPTLAAALSLLLIMLLTLGGQLRLRKCGARALLWCLPCFAVALANFPYSALISGAATIDRAELLPLFALTCIATGVFEELAFRGLIFNLMEMRLSDRKCGTLIAALGSSALFGAMHIFNILGGADVGATLLQTGYAFLLGMMFSAMLLKTGNVWLCAATHAVFNIGGQLIPTLGTGAFQDTAFWVVTAVCGAICALHVGFYLVRHRTSPNCPTDELS